MARVDRLRLLTSSLFPFVLNAMLHSIPFQLGNRAESEAMFEKWLVRVNRMLVMEDKEVF
jgi:hypothetical protein